MDNISMIVIFVSCLLMSLLLSCICIRYCISKFVYIEEKKLFRNRVNPITIIISDEEAIDENNETRKEEFI
jgi:hypothetical protein